MEAELLSLLREHPMLSSLPVAEWRVVMAGSEPITCLRGEILYRQGQPAETAYLLQAGTVLLQSHSLSKRDIGPIVAGQWVGTEALAAGLAHEHTALAATHVTAWPVSGPRLRQRLDRNFDLAMSMMAAISGMLRIRIKEISDFKLQSTTERLAGYLADLAAADGGAAEVRLPCSKRVLAERLGMDPATLSRSFAKLRRMGVTVGPCDQVLIADVAVLREAGGCDELCRVAS